jgi:hypothetical protein
MQSRTKTLPGTKPFCTVLKCRGRLARLSNAGEIVHAVLPTYPGERNLTYADMTSAKWVTDDCIRVLLRSRRDWLASWFDVRIEALLICRHNNWKTACKSCSNAVQNGIDKQLEREAARQNIAKSVEPRLRLGKERDRL